MKVCPYARQQCKYPDKGCPREEELRPVFASSPERAVHLIWSCEWSGSRVPAAAYLMYLIEEERLISHGENRSAGEDQTPALPEEVAMAKRDDGNNNFSTFRGEQPRKSKQKSHSVNPKC